MQIGKLFEKCQNYRLFDIFWDILNKVKDKLGQECAKGGIEIIAPDFSGKMIAFSSFDPTFPPVPP